MRALSDRQQRFVDEYLIDLNGRAAARRVGYAASSQGSAAARMMKTPHVRAAIDAAMAARAADARLNARAVMDELAAVGFFDPGALVDASGAPIPLEKLDPRVRAGIGTLEIIERGEERRVRWRPGEKVRALWLLGKHMGVSIPEAGRAALEEAREREARKRRIDGYSGHVEGYAGTEMWNMAAGLEQLIAEEKAAAERGEAPPERSEEWRAVDEHVRFLGQFIGLKGANVRALVLESRGVEVREVEEEEEEED